MLFAFWLAETGNLETCFPALHLLLTRPLMTLNKPVRLSLHLRCKWSKFLFSNVSRVFDFSDFNDCPLEEWDGEEKKTKKFCFFLRFFFYVNHFKVLIESITKLLLFYVLIFFFFCWVCGILAPLPGVKPTPLALEGEVLTTGPPRRSPQKFYLLNQWICCAWDQDENFLSQT